MTYIINDNGTDREMTADEIVAFETARQSAIEDDARIASQQAEQQAAKESARAKLAALGLTEEEIAALVG